MIMEKKIYETPMTEVIDTEMEELLTGSINLDDEGGDGTLDDTEYGGSGMSRGDDLW